MTTKGNKQIKVTLVRSFYGRLQRHKDTVRGLGLRRMHHTVTVQDTPEIRGMIASISDMLRVEE
ncbi:MAG TPA: 50S ribosomal protein L30 [Gammaproteobacteria bacterium]|nr:50S ribosomal protein L30 [Gammaproteobacteria bacterium]